MTFECLEVLCMWVGLGRSAPPPVCFSQRHRAVCELFRSYSRFTPVLTSFPDFLHSFSSTEPRGNSWVQEILSMASKVCVLRTPKPTSVVMLRDECTTTCVKGPQTRPLPSLHSPPLYLWRPPPHTHTSPVTRAAGTLTCYVPCKQASLDSSKKETTSAEGNCCVLESYHGKVMLIPKP